LAVLEANAYTYTHYGPRGDGPHPFLGLAEDVRVVHFPDEGAFSLKLSTIEVVSDVQANEHIASLKHQRL
jgi:hypothetical protein